MAGSDKFIIQYEYKNNFYDVEATEDVHSLLKNDTLFFEQYVLSKGNENTEYVPERIIAIQTSVASVTTVCKRIHFNGNSDESSEAKTLKWTKETTMLLISSYKEKKDDFRNPKIKKRALWTLIKEEFYNHGYAITEEELDRKWRNLKKTYTGLLDNKKSTGRGRIYWEYFDDFQEIYSADKSVHFPQTISTTATISSSIIPVTSSSAICAASSSVMSSLVQLPQFSSSPKCVNLAGPSTSKNSAGPSNVTNLMFSSVRDEEKVNKRMRNKNLYSLRKRLTDLDEKRLEELTRIRLAIEENNRIQKERNELLKQIVNK